MGTETLEHAIAELIAVTKNIIEFTDEVDDTFIELLEDRNRLFESLQNKLDASSLLNEQQQLQELYELTKQAEIATRKLKNEAAENIKKIQKSKQTHDLYEHGRGNRSNMKRNSYQAKPDAAFFDKKK